MKKTDNRYKNYKSLSAHESALLHAVKGFIVFSLSTAQKFTNWEHATVSNTLTSLKKKGILTPVKKDYYVVTEKIPENIFAIATSVIIPSYISFWTALSYYGLTEQQVKTVQVVSTKQYPQIKIDPFTIETITYKPFKFFGYRKVSNASFAEKEKLVVDMLFKPELCGGMEEVAKCLGNIWPEIHQKTLLKYLTAFKNKSCFARLGYFIETLQLKSIITMELKKNLPKGFILLYPSKKKIHHYNKTWRVIIND